MQETQYTLEELERLAGISRRMIRHFISLKLVDGSLERGPKARYGESTLRRLRLIARLRKTPVEPLGRPITTSEMRSVLDSVGEEGLEEIASGMPMRFFDTEASTSSSRASAREFLDSMADPTDTSSQEGIFHEPSLSYDQASIPDLQSLLQSLLSELTQVLHESQLGDNRDWKRWRSTHRAGLEIRLQVPQTQNESNELAALASEIRALLKQL
jgi:DNA-binding transcriptional MerR regulator